MLGRAELGQELVVGHPLEFLCTALCPPDVTRSAPLTAAYDRQARTVPRCLILLKVTNPAVRSFYEIEAAREGWSSRELEREEAERTLRLTPSESDDGEG